MSDDLRQLETWASGLLAALAPAARRQLALQIGAELRRSQQQRIAAQQNPDGSGFEPRKAPRTRDRQGGIKRTAMFRKIGRAKHLRVKADASGVAVGFFGRVARIARVHQEGLNDAVNPGGPRVTYPRRSLLGFTQADRERIRGLLLDHLSER